MATKGNTQKKKNAGIIGIALIVLAIIISVGTYAYYRTTVTGSIEGSILEWECKAGGSDQNFALTLGDLYPGKTGSFPINLSVKNFKARFEIGIDPLTITNVDNVVFKHENTILCKGDNDPSGCSNTYFETLDGSTTGIASEVTSITYEWPLGSAQTTNIPATSTSSAITIRIVCRQLDETPYIPSA